MNNQYVVFNNRGVQLDIFDDWQQATDYANEVNSANLDVFAWVEAHTNPEPRDMWGKGILFN